MARRPRRPARSIRAWRASVRSPSTRAARRAGPAVRAADRAASASLARTAVAQGRGAGPVPGVRRRIRPPDRLERVRHGEPIGRRRRSPRGGAASARQRSSTRRSRDGARGPVSPSDRRPGRRGCRRSARRRPMIAAARASHRRARPRHVRRATDRRRRLRPGARPRPAAQARDRAARRWPSAGPPRPPPWHRDVLAGHGRQIGERREDRGPVLGPAAASSAALGRVQDRGGPHEVAAHRVEPAALDPQPDPGRPDRVARQAQGEERLRLVPPPECDRGLGRDGQQQPAVGPFDADVPRPLPSRGRDIERLGGPPDAIEQDREVRRPERDAFDAAEFLGDRRPSRNRSTPSSTRPSSARSVPRMPSASASSARDPTVRATSRASSAIGIESAKRASDIRTPAVWARIRGPRGRRRSARDEPVRLGQAAAAAARSPASHRYQRCRSSRPPPARGRRPHRPPRSRGGRARPPPVLADQDGGLRGPDEDLDRPRRGWRSPDAVPSSIARR